MGGKALRTGVAGGMSGSPVYVDGKLIGAVALRISVFSPDAICGITPIELMLEINDYDESRPSDAKLLISAGSRTAMEVPGELLSQAVAAGASGNLPAQTPLMVPIETPLVFSGFHDNVLREFGPMFNQMGITAVQGGAAARIARSEACQGLAECAATGRCDRRRARVGRHERHRARAPPPITTASAFSDFGHPFFNLGPVSMPMSKGEILMVLSSQFQPNKFGNATEIVGALKQDRHSGIMGDLGATADMIPVSVKVRSYARWQRGPQREGSEVQRVRPPEVDAVPDDGHAVQLRLRHERLRRGGDISFQR